jgi:two-component system sensor histidine kinase UhpB
MSTYLGSFAAFWQRLRRLSIFNRVLLGNSAVIVVGAIGGTLITRHLSKLPIASDLWLIGLFATAGILLSLLVNYWIVRSALNPLRELRAMVERVQAGRVNIDTWRTRDADPDIGRLAAATYSMLERLEGRTLQLRALSERAINAQEDERKRIARGLHDDTCQGLSTLIIYLERLGQALPADRPEFQQRLACARQLATNTLEEVRKLIYGLRPTMLDDLGLAPAIRWYAKSRLEEAGVRVTFGALDEATRLPPQLETTLFRIGQEAVNNIVRHAEAKCVTISFQRDDGNMCLQVDDDGRGFDVARITGQALRLQRLGLLGIHERAELVGGDVLVDSAPGQGTRLLVRVPLLGMGVTNGGQDPHLAG